MATLPARSIGPVFAKPISDCSFPILRIGDGKTGTLAMNDWLLLAAQLVFLQCPQLGDSGRSRPGPAECPLLVDSGHSACENADPHSRRHAVPPFTKRGLNTA